MTRRAARRQFMRTVAAAVAVPWLGRALASDGTSTLVMRVARVPVVGAPHPDTDAWTFEGSVPGPVLRYRQGDRLRIAVENRLPDATTVHWHGVRVPHAMDGVPHLTQPPIATGERFVYSFPLEDAGTFWYHPHARSREQVGRGLYGALIVDEAEPPAVDRDVVWVLDDWRLDRSASIIDDFDRFMDASHAGRIGNTVTVNGRIVETFDVTPGERIRLRLVNAANARVFALRFEGHAPIVVALDGHPVEPHAPEGGRVVLGPGMRADLLLDATADTGTSHRVIDDYYPRDAYRLLDLRYGVGRRRGKAGASIAKLRANPLAEPDVERAERHVLRFEGGMMGGRPLRDAFRLWTINGRAMREDAHDHEPLLTLARGRPHVVDLVNDTMWPHPIHLHGHAFRVLSIDGRPRPHREWRDTVLLEPRQRGQIAFVADNPGDWMLHCHILEHQATGMMTTLRVA